MSGLTENRALVGFASLSRLQLLLRDEGYLDVLPAFEPRPNQSSLPPPDPSLPPSFCPSPCSHPPLLTLNPPASPWIGGGCCLPLCHIRAAATVSLPLLLSPSTASSLSLSLSLPPLPAVLHSLASLFSTPLPISETNFSVCRSHKERDYGLICWLRPRSASRQVAAPYSPLVVGLPSAI